MVRLAEDSYGASGHVYNEHEHSKTADDTFPNISGDFNVEKVIEFQLEYSESDSHFFVSTC